MRERRHGLHSESQLKRNQRKLDHSFRLLEGKRKRKLSQQEGPMLAQGSLGSLNAELLFSLQEEVTHDLEIQLVGAFVATIQLQVAPDGVNYVAAQVTNVTSGATSADMTAPGVYRLLGLPGAPAKAKMTARTSGAAAVSIRATRSN